MCLIVSGGHTHLVHIKDYDDFDILGKTRDDAAGEAFDKVARVYLIQVVLALTNFLAKATQMQLNSQEQNLRTMPMTLVLVA